MEDTKIVIQLRKLLANSYALFFKTHSFHWNVKGRDFFSLHAAFEEQYTDLYMAIDIVAERIRSLGHDAPVNFKQLLLHSSLIEEDSIPSSNDMLIKLANDHNQIIVLLRDLISLAEQENDVATVDLANDRLDIHEKTLWMLKSATE